MEKRNQLRLLLLVVFGLATVRAGAMEHQKKIDEINLENNNNNKNIEKNEIEKKKEEITVENFFGKLKSEDESYNIKVEQDNQEEVKEEVKVTVYKTEDVVDLLRNNPTKLDITATAYHSLQEAAEALKEEEEEDKQTSHAVVYNQINGTYSVVSVTGSDKIQNITYAIPELSKNSDDSVDAASYKKFAKPEDMTFSIKETWTNLHDATDACNKLSAKDGALCYVAPRETTVLKNNAKKNVTVFDVVKPVYAFTAAKNFFNTSFNALCSALTGFIIGSIENKKAVGITETAVTSLYWGGIGNPLTINKAKVLISGAAGFGAFAFARSAKGQAFIKAATERLASFLTKKTVNTPTGSQNMLAPVQMDPIAPK